MPLPTPILDDRSWQQLRDELVRRIPVYTPEWTDHNASDPGITLLELFAFLGENLLFRFNQIPENTRLAFLKLLQVPMRPAVAAAGMLQLSLTGATEVLVPLGTEARAGSVPFETQDEVKVWPLDLRAVARLKQAAPDPASDAGIYAEAARSAAGLSADQVAYYESRTLDLDPTAPGFTPLDFGATVDGMLWVAVLSTPATDIGRLSSAVLNLGFVPDPQVASMAGVDPCPNYGQPATSTTDELVWEASTSKVSADAPVYTPLTVVGDTSRALTRSGVIRLKLPADVTLPGLPLPADPDLEGTGDFPPVLEDDALARRLLFWIRAYRRQGSKPLPGVLWVGSNAAELQQLRTSRGEFLGTGTAGADQTFPLAHAPVIPGSLTVEVEEPGGWTPWTSVDDLGGAGPDDRVYVLDPEAGTIRFGDALRGRVPQIGQRLRAREYRYGGGSAGNVGAASINRVIGIGGVKASNPLPATGGADAESVEAALERIPGELRRHDRAVCADDFRTLAAATPGAGVGRAEVLPLFDPATGEDQAAGVVSLVVWPAVDAAHPNAPMPDKDLLRRVCQWLEPRRLVTTELYVIPPTYRRVAVSVGLAVDPGFGLEAVRAWVELVIRQYLAPLPPYGPSGGGWPLGRRVYGPELEAAALQVEGVDYLEGLELAQWLEDADGNGSWVSGTVLLQPYEVPEVTQVTVVQGAPLPAGTAFQPPAPAQTLMPVPTLSDVC